MLLFSKLSLKTNKQTILLVIYKLWCFISRTAQTILMSTFCAKENNRPAKILESTASPCKYRTKAKPNTSAMAKPCLEGLSKGHQGEGQFSFCRDDGPQGGDHHGEGSH